MSALFILLAKCSHTHVLYFLQPLPLCQHTATFSDIELCNLFFSSRNLQGINFSRFLLNFWCMCVQLACMSNVHVESISICCAVETEV